MLTGRVGLGGLYGGGGGGDTFIEGISTLDLCYKRTIPYLEFPMPGGTDEFAPAQQLESQSILADCKVGWHFLAYAPSTGV